MNKLFVSLAVACLVAGGLLVALGPLAGAGEGTAVSSPAAPGLDLGKPQGGMAPAPEGDGTGVLPPEDLGDIAPFEQYDNARFAINSVALRDCKMGAINLVGPPPGSLVLKAYLYWQWGCLDVPRPGFHDTIRFKQVFPMKVGGNVSGVLVGVAPNPCWCDPAIYSAYTYRADVTAFMSPSGAGSYGVILKNGSAGSFNYQDPWLPFFSPNCLPAEPPLFEGAVLVVVYESSCEPNGVVALYDGILPSTMFVGTPGVTYNLIHPPMPLPITEARWAHGSCDGQTGMGYVDVPVAPTLGTTNTFINGGIVAGPGSAYNDSDFNGSAGKPLPQLFESSGHDFTVYADQGAPLTNIAIFDPFGTGSDCIISDVNVIFFR